MIFPPTRRPSWPREVKRPEAREVVTLPRRDTTWKLEAIASNAISNQMLFAKYQSVEETSPCVNIPRIKDIRNLSRVSDLLGQLLGDQAVIGLHHHVLHPPLLQSFRSIEIKPSLLPPSPPVDWPLIKSRQKNNSDELQQVAGRLLSDFGSAIWLAPPQTFFSPRIVLDWICNRE